MTSDMTSNSFFGSDAQAATPTSFVCSASQFTDAGCGNIYGYVGLYVLDVVKCGKKILF